MSLVRYSDSLVDIQYTCCDAVKEVSQESAGLLEAADPKLPFRQHRRTSALQQGLTFSMSNSARGCVAAAPSFKPSLDCALRH